ncbi:MAG: hypothetical protein ACHQIG_03265 [Acidimicrobiia bacterium]
MRSMELHRPTSTPDPPRAPAGRPSRPTREWLLERVDGRWGLVVGVVWLVAFEVSAALEPRTSHEEPVIGVVIAVVMWSLIAAMVAGLAMQRRWGLGAALASAAFFTAAVIACPTTGHHTFGTWWYGEFAAALAFLGASAYALQRAPSVEPEPDDLS